MADTLVVNADSDSLWTAVADLVPEFRARADEGERLRTTPADLVERAKAAGLFRLSLPASSAASNSTRPPPLKSSRRSAAPMARPGWTIVIGNSTAFFAWLDPEVAREMIGEHTNFVSTSMWAPLRPGHT